jgi:alkylhydroperoxidase family enzyme
MPSDTSVRAHILDAVDRDEGTPADALIDTVADAHGCARIVAADTLRTLERDGEVYAVGEGDEREVFKT